MAKIGKVVQISAVPANEDNHATLYALTEDGKIYATLGLSNFEDTEWIEVGKRVKE